MGRALVLAVVVVLVAACNNASTPPDAASDALPVGPLFGEPCALPPFPQVADCHDGSGTCIDSGGTGVCRPYCVADGYTSCAQRDGAELVTDRGVCVCVPR